MEGETLELLMACMENCFPIVELAYCSYDFGYWLPMGSNGFRFPLLQGSSYISVAIVLFPECSDGFPLA